MSLSLEEKERLTVKVREAREKFLKACDITLILIEKGQATDDEYCMVEEMTSSSAAIVTRIVEADLSAE